MLLKFKTKSHESINSLTLEEVNNNIYFEDIQQVMHGSAKQRFSIITKKLLFYICSIFIPIVMILSLITSSNVGLQTVFAIIVEGLIIVFMTYQFFSPYNNFFKYGNYEHSRYSIVKWAYLSIFAMGYGMDEGIYIVNFLIITTCLFIFLFLYEKVEENMILEEINTRFNKQYKTSKFLSIVLKLSGILVVLLFVAMQLYRMNKWWLGESISTSSNSTSLIDNLIGVFVGIPILLLITLIPTYFLFDAKDYVTVKIVRKYPEEFRERYDYSKKDWYGDN